MADFSRRALTPGEIALGRSVFGEELAWARLRIAQAPAALGFGAMVPLGRAIYFARWRAPADFAHSPLSAQGWFVHELMHCWQAAQGVVLPLAKLGALGARAYQAPWRAGASLWTYNVEAQAEIVRRLFLARAGEDVGVARGDLEAVWGARRA